MIPDEIAEAQERVLRDAAAASPLRQVRVELLRRASEWDKARGLCKDGGEDYEIDLVGAIAPGDRVLVVMPSFAGEIEDEAAPVLRILHRDGQSTIHCTPNSTGRDLYLNYAGPSSPVVVRR